MEPAYEITKVQAKGILNEYSKIDSYFGTKWGFNIYRGCQHGCVYCDTRSECYKILDLTKITVKENAPELLEKALRSKRKKHTINFGSMNDPYMPIEKELQLTRQCLQIIEKYKYPIHIITKSNLILKDIRIISEIGKIYSAVTFSISTSDDILSSKIEPFASSPSQRFEALSILSSAGIYTGIAFMPILPYITDQEENIISTVENAYKAGASYIIPGIGMTLRDNQRSYYYDFLDKEFPEIKEKYIKEFKNNYGVGPKNYKKLKELLGEKCREYNIPLKISTYYEKASLKQLELFDY